jgi:hypothetical protein
MNLLSRTGRTINVNTNSVEYIPNVITGVYSENYNINYVDNIIRKKLKEEQTIGLNKLKLNKETLERTIMRPQDYISRKSSLLELDNICSEIKEIESCNRLSNYISKSGPILEEYSKYSNKYNTIIFDDNTDNEPVYNEETRKKVIIIERFLNVCKKYININVTYQSTKQDGLCHNCGELLKNAIKTDNGLKRCEECQTEHRSIITYKADRDINRINNSSCEDESIENFLKALARYQGLQKVEFNDNFFEELDSYFIQRGNKPACEIKKLPLDKLGRRGGTTPKMIWTAMGKMKYPEYYEDYNFIGHKLYNWTLPNVSKYKEQIIDDYNQTQKIFYQIPIEERMRTSSLGTQYRLWRHLQLVSHECYMEDFKIAEHDNSLKTHHKIWNIMCERCDNPNIYYID